MDGHGNWVPETIPKYDGGIGEAPRFGQGVEKGGERIRSGGRGLVGKNLDEVGGRCRLRRRQKIRGAFAGFSSPIPKIDWNGEGQGEILVGGSEDIQHDGTQPELVSSPQFGLTNLLAIDEGTVGAFLISNSELPAVQANLGMGAGDADGRNDNVILLVAPNPIGAPLNPEEAASSADLAPEAIAPQGQ